MKKQWPSKSVKLTLLPGGVGVAKNGFVSTISGCEKVDGITSHKILDRQLSELLNDLERQVETLEYKYLEVLDMWLTATTHLVKLLPSITKEGTTDR